ncbi:MAG: endopeptidase La, partial [Alphaproteobacteria bacterium]|nr:endopeptidase La [Alphaproteobacteria bacterium]
NVTAIGGLKEKLLGAIRGGIKKVLIPAENEKDLAEVPEKVKKALEIVPVSTIEEVLTHALIDVPKPLSPDSVNKIGKISPKTAENKEKSVIHH